MQGLEDALKCQNEMMLIFSKYCNVSFFQTYDQNSLQMTESKRL